MREETYLYYIKVELKIDICKKSEKEKSPHKI